MRRLWYILLAVVVISLMIAPVASAQQVNPTNVPTSAQVDGAGTPPTVINAWMLPDMVPGDGPDIDLVAPYEEDPSQAHVTVAPNLGNNPPQFMGFWAVVQDPNGVGDIRDVFVDVFHPDGTPKYQVHLVTRLTCAQLGNATTAGTPLGAAVYTGQKTAAEAAQIVEMCNQGLWAVYTASAEITKDQPYGLYSYQVGVIDAFGNTGLSGIFNFLVLQIAGLALDFSAVSFGNINPLTPQLTDGNAVFCPGDGLPTVMSIGNVWLNLNVRFDELVGPSNKVIDVFDVVLGMVDDDPWTQPRYESGMIYADAATLLSGYTLLPNCPTKIQFSVHPEILGPIRTAAGQTGVPAGAYTGAVMLWGSASTWQWPAVEWQTWLDHCPPETCNAT